MEIPRGFLVFSSREDRSRFLLATTPSAAIILLRSLTRKGEHEYGSSTDRRLPLRRRALQGFRGPDLQRQVLLQRLPQDERYRAQRGLRGGRAGCFDHGQAHGLHEARRQ